MTLCVLPLYHIYAMNVTMLPFLHTGSKVVFMPKFESTSFVNALRKYKVKRDTIQLFLLLSEPNNLTV